MRNVVLGGVGGVGRNFSAGMSGGIAYVFDEKGDFEIRCNRAMVELEKIADSPASSGDWENQELPENMLANDALRLKILIARHARHTGSARGQLILENWEECLPGFVKVMPVEYRKVLEGLAKR